MIKTKTAEGVMGCGYSKLTGSKKRGRLKVRKDGQDGGRATSTASAAAAAGGLSGGDCDECGDADDDDDEIDICSDSSTDFEQSDSGSDKYRRLEEGTITSSPEILRSKHVVDEPVAGRHRIANKIRPISGPMRPQINRSASQLSFFRMLDEKIANGKDLDEEEEEEEEERRSVQVSLRRRNSSVVRRQSVDSEVDFSRGCGGSSKSNGDVRTGPAAAAAADDSCRESAADADHEQQQQPTNGQVMVS